MKTFVVKAEPFDFEMTLVFLIDKHGEVLLSEKLTKIGKNRWNGPGGKVEPNDSSIEERAVEEVRQEWGFIVPTNSLRKTAICYFRNINDDGSEYVCKVHVFVSRTFFGVARSSSEMGEPRSFKIDKLPFDDMIVADRFWVLDALRLRKIVVKATMKDNQRELVGMVNVIPVASFG
jgi:8-oxo-dGTP pyrophosphatase MutT (NUDIX family)